MKMWWIGGFLVALAAMWFSPSAGSRGSNTSALEGHRGFATNDMNGKDHLNVQCVGRFRLTVPDSMVVAGRSQSIYDVDVSTLPIPHGGIGQLWDTRLAKIRSTAAMDEASAASSRTFELLPGTRAVWFIGNRSSPHLREIEALMPSNNHAVLAITGGAVGKESLIENLVRIVLNSYVPSTAQGFCVGDGAVTSVPGVDEETLMSLDHVKFNDFDIRFETRVVTTPDTETYSNAADEADTGNSEAKVSVLRDRARSVAGLEGKEIEIHLSPPGESASFRLTWHFPGVPGDSAKPTINIVGMAEAKQQTELEKIWDSLLQSIEAVPPAARRP